MPEAAAAAENAAPAADNAAADGDADDEPTAGATGDKKSKAQKRRVRLLG